MLDGIDNSKDLVKFAHRLGSVYSGSLRIDELRFPGLAKRAHHLFKNNPKRYGLIAAKLMDGIPATRIAKENHINPDTVRFIRQLHPELLAAGRQHMVSSLEETVIALSRRLMDDGHKLPLDKVPHALATTLDKLTLLTGGVTARVEHTSVPKPEELKKLFDALPQV